MRDAAETRLHCHRRKLRLHGRDNSAVRVAAIDIGTNSTRLLVAEIEHGSLARELDRRTVVTRLGDGVDRNGRLGDEAMSRVFDTCAEFRRAIERHRAAASLDGRQRR